MEQDKQSAQQTAIIGVVKDKKRFPWIRFSSRRAKVTVLSLAVFLLIVANTFLIYKYNQDQKLAPVNEQEVAYNQAKTVVQDSYLKNRGEQDSKVEYMLLIQKGDDAAALAIFEQQAEQSSSPELKASVYRQLYSTATVAEKYDHALVAVLGLAELQPGFETYYIMAETYAKMGNTQGQIDSIKMAASTLSTTNPEEQAIRLQLEEQIKGLETGVE